MPIIQAPCSTFKQDMLARLHDFTTGSPHVFKLALYTSAADLGPATPAYTATGEISGAGYTAGGKALTIAGSMPGLGSTTAFTDFEDCVWTPATFTGVRGALVYNSSVGNKAICVLDFGADKASIPGGDFIVVFPPADIANALIRIA